LIINNIILVIGSDLMEFQKNIPKLNQKSQIIISIVSKGFRDPIPVGCSVPSEARTLLRGQRVSKSCRTLSSNCLTYLEYSNR